MSRPSYVWWERGPGWSGAAEQEGLTAPVPHVPEPWAHTDGACPARGALEETEGPHIMVARAQSPREAAAG